MKKMIAALLLSAFTFSLVACGSSSPPPVAPNPPPASASTASPPATSQPEALPMEGIHLKMAGYAGFFPFRFTDDKGVVSGIDIDFYNEFASRLGFTWEFVDVPFAEVIAGISSGLYNMAASMSYTPERDEQLDFSTYPYYYPRIAILCQKGAGLLHVADLVDKKICVALGTTQADWAAKNVVCAQLELLEGAATYTSVLSGYNDAYISDSIELSNVAKENSDKLECNILSVSETQGGINPYRFLFQEGYEYRDLFDEALEAMYEDGTLDKIITSWLGDEFAMDEGAFVPGF